MIAATAPKTRANGLWRPDAPPVDGTLVLVELALVEVAEAEVLALDEVLDAEEALELAAALLADESEEVEVAEPDDAEAPVDEPLVAEAVAEAATEVPEPPDTANWPV